MESSIKLLSFDLDGTLLGNREAVKKFKTAWDALSRESRPLLCYNTGRLFEDTLEVIEAESLPKPDYCICGVGTLIYNYSEKRVELGFADLLHHGWDLIKVELLMSEIPGTVLQPREFQNDFKSSWYLENAAELELNAIKDNLREKGLDVNVVYSSSRDLDILPRHATKGNALLWLMKNLAIRGNEVIVGGDTGNDISMFLIPGVKGIIVGNAFSELLAFKGKKNIYTSSRKITDGILEGLVYWGILESY